MRQSGPCQLGQIGAVVHVGKERRRERVLQLGALDDQAGVGEQVDVPGVVGMQVRQHDQTDIGRLHAVLRELVHQ